MKEITPEMIKKAKEAKSVEELLDLAKETGAEATEEQIRAYYESIHTSGEISDDELDNVSGGACYDVGGYMITTFYNSCKEWKCKKCEKYHDYGNCEDHPKEGERYCPDCKYCIPRHGVDGYLCKYYQKDK